MDCICNGVYLKRLQKLRECLAKKNIDIALVSKKANYTYLSGFTGTEASLLITMDHAFILTDSRYIEQASFQAPEFEVVKCTGEQMTARLNGLLSKGLFGDALGFEETYITYQKYSEYKNSLEKVKLVPLKGVIEDLRTKKDNNEINSIKMAVKIADDAFPHILQFIKPGVREIEIASEIEYFMKKSGASGASFETIVASGKRSSMPHGVATEKKLEQGDAIILDYGAVYKGYCSDITRTVFLGKPDEELFKIYNIVLKAQMEAARGAFNGLKAKEIDGIAREIIIKEGYGDNFGHGLGHGVGLEIHEQPSLSPFNENNIKNGMVVTVEPGIYLSGLGGVRIEDVVVINDQRPIVLTKSTKDMFII